MKDALTKPKKEESALGMGRRGQPAGMKDAPTMPRREVSALGMEQSAISTLAVMRVALTKSIKEE